MIEGEEKPFEEILRHDEGDGEDKNIKLDIKFSSNDGEREREKREQMVHWGKTSKMK